jgi:hypothetical protein
MNPTNFQNAINAVLDQSVGRFGEYEAKFGRVWRGGKVVAYVDEKMVVPSEFAAPPETDAISSINDELKQASVKPGKDDFVSPGDQTPVDALPDDKRSQDRTGEPPPVATDAPEGDGQEGDDEFSGPGERPTSVTRKPRQVPKPGAKKAPPVALQPGSKEPMPGLPVLTIRESADDFMQLREMKVTFMFKLVKKEDREHMETLHGKDYFYEAVDFSLVLVSHNHDKLEEREIFDYRVWHSAQVPNQEVIEKHIKRELENVCLYSFVTESELEPIARELFVKMDAVRRFTSKEPKYEGEESARGSHIVGKLREAAVL